MIALFFTFSITRERQAYSTFLLKNLYFIRQIELVIGSDRFLVEN